MSLSSSFDGWHKNTTLRSLPYKQQLDEFLRVQRTYLNNLGNPIGGGLRPTTERSQVQFSNAV